ncbi:hypothetical protein PHYBLDRAFT_157346 [Phycomyces blakesleeanus NRRL 1555(-)]|uniref:Mid2 domain-containing protein n=2 Tax=Phycomyces blakesleeanus TaxID=4837 RepID=A0A167QK18_PHYB8|nr:hypothetical protein PHYBLDRAFT_157346 [Phycomyces blakesleeanus NRRL 1555(-)]OAD79818.1 hypothetical protein PHYBLDRAFT_157346 [Phycomyces blakesleeanus NRRL 1555(-)]|eukprot:XP_018297858.1 hypothetical protein PHYBLDRAFT_157346 [Phycomyces blakesleeanus NRRL 1555(-)]
MPLFVGNALNITADDVIVITLTSAAKKTTNKKRDNEEYNTNSNGVVVTLSVPKDSVIPLQNLVSDPTSVLYSTSNGQLASLVDNSYPVSGSSSSSSSSSSASSSIVDPNSTEDQSSSSSNGGSSGNGGLSKASIIGICVSVGVVVYAAATVVSVRAYRRHRVRKDTEAQQQHQVFAQSISAPIMQENSLGWQSQRPTYHGNQW